MMDNKDKNYWIFPNGNKYTKKNFTYEKAKEFYSTLYECKDCIDCEDLVRCEKCIGCGRCSYCKNCIKCVYCVKCYNCKHCINDY